MAFQGAEKGHLAMKSRFCITIEISALLCGLLDPMAMKRPSTDEIVHEWRQIADLV
jgi:hypothetical protein